MTGDNGGESIAVITDFYSKQPILRLTQELSISRLEYVVYARIHIYPLCGVFYFLWYRHKIEGTTAYSVSSERHRQCGVNKPLC